MLPTNGPSVGTQYSSDVENSLDVHQSPHGYDSGLSMACSVTPPSIPKTVCRKLNFRNEESDEAKVRVKFNVYNFQ